MCLQIFVLAVTMDSGTHPMLLSRKIATFGMQNSYHLLPYDLVTLESPDIMPLFTKRVWNGGWDRTSRVVWTLGTL